MPRVSKIPRMKRTQISLPVDDFDAVQKVAARRSVSISSIIRSAVRKELEDEQAIRAKMMGFVNIGESSDPKGSVNHDDVIYG